MTDADEIAYTPGIEMFRAGSPPDAEYIDEKIRREGGENVLFDAAPQLEFAAGGDIALLLARRCRRCGRARDTDPTRGDYAAALLLIRMQRLGISRWHPDPERAITEATKKTAA